jgi:hypothetical protein
LWVCISATVRLANHSHLLPWWKIAAEDTLRGVWGNG